MTLSGKDDKKRRPAKPPERVHSVPGRRAFCTVCSAYREFSRCWHREAMVGQCPCCGLIFEDAAALYNKVQPSCSQCGEFLEHPGFVYGLCDGCGSKFELVEGTKPGWLPNKKQRDRINRTGKSWSRD